MNLILWDLLCEAILYGSFVFVINMIVSYSYFYYEYQINKSYIYWYEYIHTKSGTAVSAVLFVRVSCCYVHET